MAETTRIWLKNGRMWQYLPMLAFAACGLTGRMWHYLPMLAFAACGVTLAWSIPPSLKPGFNPAWLIFLYLRRITCKNSLFAYRPHDLSCVDIMTSTLTSKLPRKKQCTIMINTYPGSQLVFSVTSFLRNLVLHRFLDNQNDSFYNAHIRGWPDPSK